MAEAEFCCDEGACLADKYFRERECRNESLDKRIENQREEIRRLQKCLNDTKQSRDHWKAEAERIGKQLQKIITEREKNEKENSIRRS